MKIGEGHIQQSGSAPHSFEERRKSKNSANYILSLNSFSFMLSYMFCGVTLHHLEGREHGRRPPPGHKKASAH